MKTLVAIALAVLLAMPVAAAGVRGGGNTVTSTGVQPISRGGTGQTSSNYAAAFPPGLATLFVFNTFQMHQDSQIIDNPQFIPAAVSSAPTPTLLTSFAGGSTNPTLIARKWTAALLSVGGVGAGSTDQCPQFSVILDPGAVAISATGKYEFMLLVKQQNTPAFSDLIMNTSLTTDGPGFRLTTAGATGGGGNYVWATSNGAATINTLSATATTTRALRRKWHIVDVSGDGSNQTMRIMGLGGTTIETVGPTANGGGSPAGSPTHAVTVGGAYNCTAHQDTIIGGIAIWARALSAAERATAVTALFQSAEIDPNVDMKKILVVGDSIMAGSTPNVEPTPWQYLQAFLPNYRITQRAVSGAQTPAIVTALTDELTVETPDVVIVQGGTNDITAGTADATISANLLSMCTSAKAAGAKCILMNITPGDTGNQAVHTPIVNATSASRTIPTQIDALFDANTLLHSPGGTQVAWDSTYQQDTLHPNALGCRAIAKGLADTVIALTGN